MLDDAAAMKAALKAGKDGPKPLAGKSVAMIFEKPSTRTRVSFEVGITQLGGTPLMLSAQDMQIGRGEASRIRPVCCRVMSMPSPSAVSRTTCC